MKNITTILLLLTIASMAPSAIALAPPSVPDGGASSLLLGIGAVSLVAARRFFGKK